MERIVLTTGGTGGHIFPALAVAEELKSRFPGVQILFVGGADGPERRLAESAHLEFVGLPAKGVLGKGIGAILAIFWMIGSYFKARSIFKKFQPQVVLGLGGYAGFIPVLVAGWRNIPTAIHEQNSIPGMTNRILGRRADRVFLSFPDDHHFFSSGKTTLSGNPVRSSIVRLRNVQRKSAGRNMLVLGGSQGARAINDAVIADLVSFSSLGISLRHQCGAADFERVHKAYIAHGLDRAHRVEAFIDDMAEAYAWADIVVCRAGATTLSELTTVGKPSLLIPYPYAIHDHQLNNAKMLEAAGAAMVLVQSYLGEVSLARAVGDLLSSPEKLKIMAEAAAGMGKPEAAKLIVDGLEGLVEPMKAQGKRE